MRKETIEIFTFDELSKEIQERIISEYRHNDSYPWQDENKDSLDEFCNTFSVLVTDFQYGYHNYITGHLNDNEEICELSGYRLNSYLHSNYYNLLFPFKTYWYGRNKKTGKLHKK